MILIAVFVGVVAVVVRKRQSKSNLAKTTFRKLSLQVHQANFGSSLTHSLSKSLLLSPKLLSSWYRQSRKSLRTRLSPLTTHCPRTLLPQLCRSRFSTSEFKRRHFSRRRLDRTFRGPDRLSLFIFRSSFLPLYPFQPSPAFHSQQLNMPSTPASSSSHSDSYGFSLVIKLLKSLNAFDSTLAQAHVISARMDESHDRELDLIFEAG